MHITIHSLIDSMFTFSTSHTVTNKNQFVSISTSTLKNYLISRIFMVENDNLLYVFYIKVQQIHKIFVLFPLAVYYKVELFDGPGFQSPILRNTNHVYETSTFQCTGQISTQKRWMKMEKLFNYTSSLVNISHISKISSNEQSFKINLPMSKCLQQHCALYLFTEEKFQINITLIDMIYKGPKGERCKYGGYLTGEETVKSYKESLTVCEQHGGDEHHGLTLSSQNSSLILFVYWYKYYSEISINAYVSLTKCTAVKVDICTLQELCYPKIKKNFHLPKCKSNALTFGYKHIVHFSLHDLECMVIQFRKMNASLDGLSHPHCSIHLSSDDGSQEGREIQYTLKGSLYSFLYNFRIKNRQSRNDYVAISGNTNDFISIQRLPKGKFNFSYKVVQNQNKATLCIRDDFLQIVQTLKNKYFYIWASQPSSSVTDPLIILVELAFCPHSWIDVAISKQDIKRTSGSSLRDMYLTESITFPSISDSFKSIGHRCDQFLPAET